MDAPSRAAGKAAAEEVEIYKNFNFRAPAKGIIKIHIDLRPTLWQSQITSTATMPAATSSRRVALGDFTNFPREGPPFNPENLPHDSIFRPENNPPRRPPGGPAMSRPFGDYKPPSRLYGGLLLQTDGMAWINNHYARASGAVIRLVHATEQTRMFVKQVVRSTSVMAYHDGNTQSGIWVSPRIFISTLHFKHWNTGSATQIECQTIRDQGVSFLVENEISSKLLDHAHSDRIKLKGFQVDDDIGIFQLEDGYPDRVDWVPVESLVEPDEAVEYGVAQGSAVACVGYCGSVSEADAKVVRDTAMQQLSPKLGTLVNQVPLMDFNEITKPGMKSVGSGPLVVADRQGDRVKYGVAIPLWYGSSGGPCILLEGPRAGQIIGLAWGSMNPSDPYNVVTGIMKGLKNHIKSM